MRIDETYEEQFRQFLLDDGWSFPDDAVLMLELLDVPTNDAQRISSASEKAPAFDPELYGERGA